MRYLILLLSLSIPFFSEAQQENPSTEKRCKCRARRDFILEKNDSCFAITRAEADRFFGCRCWDEAMLLYRAAKSCTDANQNARSEMNKRIQACRDSADLELRRSEQAARRQFLHATAANLAYDAQALLKNYDRSTAYRLADFAERYVAPGPNPECLQALLDAWYYVPPQQSGQESSALRVPFCYQLDYDMGGGVQSRFGASGWLYAYSPTTSTLFSWESKTWEPKKPIQIEKGLPYFDISPDERTLLFFSANTLLFWRGVRDTFKVQIPGITRYCFSPSGDELFFSDNQQGKVFSIELSAADMVQRNFKNVQTKGDRGEKRPEPRMLFAEPFEVIGMAAHGRQLWLAGRDSIVVMELSMGKERQWKLVSKMSWNNGPHYYAYYAELFPKRRTALVVSADSLHYYHLPDTKEALGEAAHLGNIAGTTLAIKPDGEWFAYTRYESLGVASDSSAIHYGCYVQPGEEFRPLSGAISPDSRWLAAATDTGTLKIWALHDWQGNVAASLPDVWRVVFSPGGDQFACHRGGVLQVFNTEQPSKPFYTEPIDGEEVLMDAMGNDWVAWRVDAESIHLKNVKTGQRWKWPVESDMSSFLPVAFDDAGRHVAYSVNPDTVIVRSLASGAVLSSQPFNGEVLQMHFLPESRELLVIQSANSSFYTESQTIAKIWNPSASSNKPRSVRLHGYKIGWSDVARSGKLMAFSSGKDIRIFHLDNLLDESARIRPLGEHIVSSLAFYPDGTALAAGYEDGTVVVWDLNTYEARFRLKVADDWIDELSFSADGSRLRLKTLQGQILSRDIAPDLIRAAAQNKNRRMAAFTSEQIREYELEKALDYSGNFQRLAESGDLPLIRSFFEYYRLQALSSNNIDRVKTYFESAASLFAKLDDPAAQRALRPVMSEIYEDYNWKLLLREKNAEAQRVLNDFNRLFDKPLAATKMSAHTALLRNDISAAARQYADWTMLVYEASGAEPYQAMDSLEQQFRQLAEYDLLSPEQRDCICGLYAGILKIENLCPRVGRANTVSLDNETRLRWHIFQQHYTASRLLNHSKKAQLLESALDDATALNRQNAARWRGELEKTTLSLAKAYTDWGIFEQGNEYSERLYQQAIGLLDTFGTFRQHEPQRLKALLTNRLLLGNRLYATDRISDAGRQYQLGLEAAQRLIQNAPADSVLPYRNDYQAPLLTQLGMVHLLDSNATAAKTYFEQAFDAMTYGLNSLYLGHVALLENNPTEALEKYKGIYNEAQLGQALFDISRMAGRMSKRIRLEAFATQLRDTILKQYPEMSKAAADYWLAENQVAYHFANHRWDKTLLWNEKSLAALELLADGQDAAYQWKTNKLNALLSRSYYFLYQSNQNPEAFEKSLECARQAEEYAEKEYPSYPYRSWLKTNVAHALSLRNHPGDRTQAISIYQEFLKKNSYDYDHWELLQKDFRDMHRNGLRWEDLKGLILRIKPADVELTEKEWREMEIQY
ncbi:MAG: WD40 repeat domain-containing protein [Saprospiraceae bacterium]|nr:WD40 repeat domain-containing protein [Saprospiraceae bacterium]